MLIKKWKFVLAYLLIFIITCYDAWWCLQIPQDQFLNLEEQNPVVSYLITKIGLKSFFYVKILCCLLVIFICELLRKIHTKMWKIVVSVLLLGQLLLLFYLEFGHVIPVMMRADVDTWGEFWWSLYRVISRNY